MESSSSCISRLCLGKCFTIFFKNFLILFNLIVFTSGILIFHYLIFREHEFSQYKYAYSLLCNVFFKLKKYHSVVSEIIPDIKNALVLYLKRYLFAINFDYIIIIFLSKYHYMFLHTV